MINLEFEHEEMWGLWKRVARCAGAKREKLNQMIKPQHEETLVEMLHRIGTEYGLEISQDARTGDASWDGYQLPRVVYSANVGSVTVRTSELSIMLTVDPHKFAPDVFGTEERPFFVSQVATQSGLGSFVRTLLRGEIE